MGDKIVSETNQPAGDTTGDVALPVIDHWLGDTRWPGTGERCGDVFDPARGVVAARVRLASAADVDTAVASARRAHGAWGPTSLSKRSTPPFSVRPGLKRRAAQLAVVHSRPDGQARLARAGGAHRGSES